MTRLRKKRSNANLMNFEDDAPRRSEKLADPNSYESRKRKALQAKKKSNKSVFQKHVEAQQADQQKQPEHRGRLADKIRRLNAEKKQQDANNA